MYNFIKVKIYYNNKFIGCIHFFNEEKLEKRLNFELSFIEKEYNNVGYEIIK